MSLFLARWRGARRTPACTSSTPTRRAGRRDADRHGNRLPDAVRVVGLARQRIRHAVSSGEEPACGIGDAATVRGMAVKASGGVYPAGPGPDCGNEARRTLDLATLSGSFRPDSSPEFARQVGSASDGLADKWSIPPRACDSPANPPRVAAASE